MSDAILQVSNLEKHFRVGRGKILRAVDNVSFAIQRGKTLGLVGESGCGKTTVGRTLLRIYEPDGGTIVFDGQDISKVTRAQAKALTRKMQMIFQDPYASLSKEHANRFPHEFSGGQRQRVGIARALALNPEFIVCDEPISALDVSIQAQVVNMLMKFQRELGLTYLFIAHDLSMVRHIADETAVMYLGTMVEYGPTEEVYGHPAHPYTQGLLSAVPVADPDYEKTHHRIPMEGEVPSPIDPKPGCRFCGRCPRATEQCRTQTPAPKDLSGGHFAACHHLD